jgi:hypothetical protein
VSKKLLSAYAASRLLGRDRQTIDRAVRHLAPDAYQNGQPRWHLERIVDVLAMSPQERREIGKYRDRYSLGRDKALDGLRLMFEKGVASIRAEPSLARRREMAVALAPVLAEYQALFLSLGRSLGIADDDVLGARAELIFSEMMDEVSEAADWSRYGDDFWTTMIEAMPFHGDDDEEA